MGGENSIPTSGDYWVPTDIDRTTTSGQRDYALFALMFNTGARAQEIVDLRVRDLRLEAPCQVRFADKAIGFGCALSGPARRNYFSTSSGSARVTPRITSSAARVESP